MTSSPSRRRMAGICAKRPSRIAGQSVTFGGRWNRLWAKARLRRRRRRAAEEREAATGQARGCLHYGGQRFESPPLHQVVLANRRDFLRHRIARHSRGLRQRQSVCWVVSTVSAAHWRRVRPKVSGRKFPFPRLLFATCPPRPTSNGNSGLEPRMVEKRQKRPIPTNTFSRCGFNIIITY